MPWRLTRYLFALHARRVALVLALVLFVIWLGQFSDLVRRMSGTGLAGLARPLGLSLMRTPALVLDVLPHVMLAGSALAVFGLARRFEVQVIVLAGKSLGQVLMPMALSGFVLGCGYLAAIDPVAAWLVSQAGPPGSFSGTGGGEVAHQASLALPGGGTVLIFAHDVLPKEKRANGISVFILGPRHRLLARIEAASADMSARPWRLTGARVERTDPAGAVPDPGLIVQSGGFVALDVPTRTLLAEVRDVTQTALWDLPAAASEAVELGRSATAYQQALDRRLALPGLLASIALLSGALAMGRTGREPWLPLVARLMVAAFVLYTVLTVAEALGARVRLSALAAAWGPVVLCLGAALLVLRRKGL